MRKSSPPPFQLIVVAHERPVDPAARLCQLRENAFDLLIELRDLSNEIAARGDRIRIVRGLLADAEREIAALEAAGE